MVVIRQQSNQNSLLLAFTTAAFALPGVIPTAKADVSPQDYSIDTNFSRYSESQGRMKVDIYQSVATLPLTDRLAVKINGVKDVVTGASPVGPALNGRPGCKGPSQGGYTQCLSSATIKEVRDAIDINTSYYLDNVTLDLDVGRSSENDYASNFFNINSRVELNNKLTTLTTGYGYASDHVWEIVVSDVGIKARAPDVGGDKETHQGIVGVTQILDKDSLLQANLTYSYSGGYLSDPYKYVYAPNIYCGFGYNCVPSAYQGFLRDTRPTSRNQVGMLLRYVRNFSELNSAALHFDYRFYADTWGIDSHTFEISWIQPIVDSWQITPRVRYYSQNSADFYTVMLDATSPTGNYTGNYSSDYRLAQFGAISGGVQLSQEFFQRLKVSGGVDFYKRDLAYSFSGGNGVALDNFSFSMFSVSLNLKF